MPPPFDDSLRLPRPELVLGYPSGVPGIDHAHEDETRVDSAICQHSRRADELTDPLVPEQARGQHHDRRARRLRRRREEGQIHACARNNQRRCLTEDARLHEIVQVITVLENDSRARCRERRAQDTLHRRSEQSGAGDGTDE